MSFYTFEFCCRFLSQKLSEDKALTSSVKILAENYPQLQVSLALNIPLYKLIVTETNPQKQQALFSSYGALTLDRNMSSLTKLANIRNYLFLISKVFLMMSDICKVFVLSVFEEIFR